MKLKSTRLPEVEVENGENYSFEIDEKDILTAVIAFSARKPSGLAPRLNSTIFIIR